MENAIRCAVADDGTATVTLRGEVDYSNADEVSAGIRDAIEECCPPVVYVDLRDASFVDSTGLGALIEGYHAAGERDCRFVVINPTSTFRRVLSVTGLLELFGLTEAEEAPAGFAPTEATGS